VRAGVGEAAGDDLDLDLALLFDVTDLALLSLRRAPAQHDLDAEALGVAATALDVAFEARVALVRHQAALAVLELRKTNAFAASQAAAAARALVDSGNLVELDALNQRALFEETRLAVARAEAEVAETRADLARALGVWGEASAALEVAPVVPEPNASRLDAADFERRVVGRSLDLAVLRERYAAAAGREELALWAGWLPELEVGPSVERGDAGWGIGPEIGLRLPLFYQGQGERAAARAEKERRASEADGVGVAVRAAARATLTKLDIAMERAEFYRATLLPLRRTIVAETLLQYNAMNVGVFQLLAAKRDELEAAAAHVLAMRDCWVARAEAEQLLLGRVPVGASSFAADAAAQGPGDDGH
jgi:outer membrane protein TolC